MQTPAHTDSETDGLASERRQLTVLFADLVGSTDLMESVGAEDYATLLRSYHTLCTDAVRARGGIVAQYQGDGIICFFGYPRGAEDDAVRAVMAALDLLRGLEARRVADSPWIGTRIGIASGTAIIRGDGDHFGGGAVGACLNRAARLEGLAEPNTALVCAATRRLVGNLFEFRDLGPQALKGFRKAEPVHRLRKRRPGVATRFEALRGRRGSPLIGRAVESEALLRHLAAARAGRGRAVVISAAAGLGKSRLVSALRGHEQVRDCCTFVLQCSPEHAGTALHPIREYLEWVAGVGGADDATARHAKLKRLFEAIWHADEEQLATLLDLLSPLGSGVEADKDASMPLRRRRAFGTLCDMIFRMVAGRSAIIFVFEDVHWIDPSSAEFLEHLIGRVADQPALVLLTTRPRPPFGEGGSGIAEVMTLEQLSEEQATALARETARDAGLSDRAIRLVVEKSDGVPLFVEEYADMIASASGLGEDEVPLTLAGLVQSKLDRLEPRARRFAQVASAVGRSFDLALARTVAGLDAAQSGGVVESLEQHHIAHRDPSSSDGSALIFTHALIRDAIYVSMDRGQRRHLHGSIADAYLAAGDSLQLGEEILAEHLAKAGKPARAIEHFLGAALASAGAGAAGEALKHLEQALLAVAELPEGEERDRLELRTRAIQGPTQMVTRGPGNPAFGATQARAMALLKGLNLQDIMVPVIYNTALHAWARADLHTAMATAREIARIDAANPDDGAHLAANTMCGLVAWHQGRNRLARDSLRATVARYDAALHHDLYSVFLKEFGVFGLFYLGLTETVLGDAASGARHARDALALARRVHRPHAVGFGLLANFTTAILRGDVETADRFSALIK